MVHLIDIMSFGADGWGWSMLTATLVTLAVASCGFAGGMVLGALIAWAKFSKQALARQLANAYTTVLRGVPDLLVIYLFYFGGSIVLSAVAGLWGPRRFVEAPAFVMGALALAFVSAAYQAEVFRGAFNIVSKGELEAARAIGMGRSKMFVRIIAPLVLRHAIPGLGNTWQLALKESALISVTGLVELLRQAQMGAGSTRRPFEFFIVAGAIYLLITCVSSILFRTAESRMMRGMRRPA